MSTRALARDVFRNPYLLAVLSGILLVLAFPPFDFSFLGWISLVPLLYALSEVRYEKATIWRLSFRKAQLAGFLCGSVFYYGTLYWLASIFGIVGLLLISVVLLYMVLFAHVLSFLLARWKNPLALMFLGPPLWVAVEYLKSEGWWLKFSWMNLGYSQHRFLPVLQSAAILGQYGISFLVVLVNSALALIIIHRANRRRCAGIAFFLLVLAGAVLLYGRHSLQRHFEPAIKVGLVQDESSDFRAYAGLTGALPEDVDLILWPEYSIPEFLEEEDDLMNRLRDLVRSRNSYLVLGAKDRVEDADGSLVGRLLSKQGVAGTRSDNIAFHNTAFLLSPTGDILGKYYKVNPIQFFADGIAGTEFPSFETSFGRIGIIICYDADYSRVARKVVQDGAELLCIPTYDALSWTSLQHEQHSAMTSMRAVENRRYVARATTSGVSQVVDPAGRILSRIGIGQTGATTGMVGTVKDTSFYTRFGYLLPYACILVSIGFLMASFIIPNREARFLI